MENWSPPASIQSESERRRSSPPWEPPPGNSFSRTARLVVITPVLSGNSSVAVRDGGNSTDVSSFFILEQLGGSITSYVVNTRTGRSSSTVYSLQHFALQDGYSSLNLHFDVRGIATDNSLNAVDELDADVSGAGDRSGASLILQGSLSIRGHTLEVVADAQLPGA